MADELRQPQSAFQRRRDQINRWLESDTNRATSSPSTSNRKVKFQDGCVFLAACSSGDRDEVLRLLDKGADINTANIDGLTALHQACIDDNLDMVEFLVDHGAEVDVCDNEGWTPLHATASCGFTEIARYLLGKNADVAAVNNDGDLPYDISEDDDMEKLLQEEMDRQGVDADAARQAEENQMLADANKWLNNKSVKEKRHPKTGATALHVAAAKGYLKVISVLLQAGCDINAKDNDGWTPLHAAAHWGQEEACKVLSEHLADFDIKNKAGQTAIDVADPEIIKLLEELKHKQQSEKDTQDSQNEIIITRGHPQKRSRSDSQRSSVTRMSVDQKQSIAVKTKERGDSSLLNKQTPEADTDLEEKGLTKSGSSSGSEFEEEEELKSGQTQQDTDKKNEINKMAPKIKENDIKTEIPKSDEKKEELAKVKPEESIKDTENIKVGEKNKESKEKEVTPLIEKLGDGDKLSALDNDEVFKNDKNREDEQKESQTVDTKRDRLARSLSAPAATEEQVPSRSTNQKEDSKANGVPSWRTGLRKTGSTSLVTDSIVGKDGDSDKAVLRSASSPRLDPTNQDKPSSRVSYPGSTTTTANDTDSRYGSRLNSPYSRPTSFTSSSYKSPNYIPYYSKQQQQQNERREREKESGRQAVAATTTTTATTSVPASSTTSMTTTVSSESSSAASTPSITSPMSSFQFRRSYDLPKRDEEAETLRKARAKRARETRRSTQGVTLEDLHKAQEVSGRASAPVTMAASSLTSISSTTPVTSTPSSVPSSSSSTTVPSVSDSLRSSRLSDSLSKDSSSSRKELSTGEDSTTVPLRRSRLTDDESRSGNRISRDSKDITETSSKFRRERPILSASEGNIGPPSLNSGTAVTRASSFRNRWRGDDNAESSTSELNTSATTSSSTSTTPTATEKESEEKSHDTRGLRTKRNRKSRRPTGITFEDQNNEDEDKDKEKEEEEKKEDDKNSGSRYSGRYSSTSDVGSTSDKYTRPSSYIDYTRSATSLDTDYRKLYEEEKIAKEKAQRELEKVKRELIEAQAELDRLMKRSDAAQNEKREKRQLERKLSEMEEELKKLDALQSENRRLKEENGALIRVISKLSR